MNPVAVMQLASSNEIVIVHLSRWKQLVNESTPSGENSIVGDTDMGPGMSALRTLLGLSQIKKVGVTLLGEIVSKRYEGDRA